MAFEWQDLNLRDYISVFAKSRISDVDSQVLLSLYQPILGITATNLYLYLMNQLSSFTDVRVTHQTLLNHLAVGMHDYYHARIRLEAMGLISTYQNESNDQDSRFYILVHQPVSAQAFLTDPIYCGLLKDLIGEADYKRVKSSFLSPQPPALKAYHDISLDFYKVFGKNLTIQMEEGKDFVGEDRAQLIKERQGFDWAFFNQLLQSTFVHPDMLTADVKSAIESIYQLYQLPPVTMREFVLQSHSLADHAISIDKLYQLARQYARFDTRAEERGQSSSQEQGQVGKSDFVQLVEETASVDFLKMIKASKNKQNPLAQKILVDPSEIKLVERLVVNQAMPMSVVNVLIYHLLVSLNMDSLHDKYAVRVANDWISHQITTAQEAMAYLDQRDKEQQERLQKRQERQEKTYRKQATKVISLSPEERAALSDTSKLVEPGKKTDLLSRLK